MYVGLPFLNRRSRATSAFSSSGGGGCLGRIRRASHSRAGRYAQRLFRAQTSRMFNAALNRALHWAIVISPTRADVCMSLCMSSKVMQRRLKLASIP